MHKNFSFRNKLHYICLRMAIPSSCPCSSNPISSLQPLSLQSLLAEFWVFYVYGMPQPDNLPQLVITLHRDAVNNGILGGKGVSTADCQSITARKWIPQNHNTSILYQSSYCEWGRGEPYVTCPVVVLRYQFNSLLQDFCNLWYILCQFIVHQISPHFPFLASSLPLHLYLLTELKPMPNSSIWLFVLSSTPHSV